MNTCGITWLINKYTSIIKSSISHQQFTPPQKPTNPPNKKRLHESQRETVSTNQTNTYDGTNITTNYEHNTFTPESFNTVFNTDYSLVELFGTKLSEYGIQSNHVVIRPVDSSTIKFKITQFYTDEYRALQHHVIPHISTDSVFSGTWYEVTESQINQLKPVMESIPCDLFDEEYKLCSYCANMLDIEPPEETTES